MDRYERGEIIAQGGYGVVRRCVDRKTNAVVVMKSIPYESKDEGVPCSVIREISVLKELDHDNVVRLHDVWDDSDGFNLVFKDMGIDLSRFIYGSLKAELGPHVIQKFLFQILQGLCYCHSRKVLHRDLKPQNLLIDYNSNTVTLADFGFAMTIDVPIPHYTTTKVAILSYKAPELLLRMPYSTAVDIWSVGCIFAEMASKKVLFTGTTETDMMDDIIRKLGPNEKDWKRMASACFKLYGTAMEPVISPLEPLRNIVPDLGEQGFKLLSEMLQVNPNRRITAYDALQHPYFDSLKVIP